MVAASILPVTIHKNKLCFLFGKENELEVSAPGWSDFGGGLKKNENPFKGALREGAEELTGFFGNADQLKKLIEENGGFLKMSFGTLLICINFESLNLTIEENFSRDL